MSVIETILIFVLIPGAIYFAIGIWTNRSKFAGTPRYRPGQDWDHPPVWWSANPTGVGVRPVRVDEAPSVAVEQMTLGGARGSW